MRSFYAWCFASLMLLSSGSMQLVLHSCPGSGVFVFTDCGMHESGESHDMPDCCKKKFPAQKPKQDCGNCEDYFVFSITPKFGSVVRAETGESPVFTIANTQCIDESKWVLGSDEFHQIQTERPPKLNHFQALHCSWLI